MNAINKLYLALEHSDVTGLKTEHWNQEVNGETKMMRRVEWRSPLGFIMEAVGLVDDVEQVVDVHFKATPHEIVEMMIQFQSECVNLLFQNFSRFFVRLFRMFSKVSWSKSICPNW